MPKILRAARYLTTRNEPLARFITEDLGCLDYEETLRWYGRIHRAGIDNKGRALLGCNDRFYLLTGMLGRVDALHPWVFARCREVERDPDGYIDLWSRYHFKSSVITTAGAIQEIMCNPEITIGIFSVVKPTAHEFLGQIKNEFEANEHLKDLYPDVLYRNPRTKGPDGRPSKWSLVRGITVKRQGRPKEATIEAHGLIDGQPTGRHFQMHIYDDVVTQDHLSDDSIKKTTQRWEMADNLGTKDGVRKWIVGTRYHFADTYGVIIDRKSAKPRIYPATDNGKLDGTPVMLTPERWSDIKRDQRSTVAAQMLLDPMAGGENTFESIWLRTYEVIPAILNVYILCDPSKGSGERSDRSAIPVIGIDQGGNKYLLDGVCHRMKLSERWEWIKSFRRKWMAHPGVQLVRVGYEQYGQQVDLEVITDMMEREKDFFEIVELGTPKQGGHSKKDRIERLEPDIRDKRFLFPCLAHHPDFGVPGDGRCYWSVWTEEHEKRAAERNLTTGYTVGQIIYRPMKGLTSRQNEMEKTGQKHRIVSALRRRDENENIYDVTRTFIDEMIRHPFAPHDDLIDAMSRIYDIEPIAPQVYEAQSTEPIDVETVGEFV